MASSGPIDDIKERIGIVDVISPVVDLRKAGRNFQGLCPFHPEKTPSFIVFPDKGNYHCFGCGANGDIFTFVMKTQNIEFADALKQLADKAGVVLPERNAGGKGGEERDRLYEINAAAAHYFHELLLQSEAGGRARTFLAERGINGETIHRFELGYSLDSWDATTSHLLKLGFDQPTIEAAGLVVVKDGGGSYDRFRGRVMFPIRDQKGRITGFGARCLDGSQPKFLNSPDTDIFDKGHTLFGLDLAAPSIKQMDRAVIVEGYIDVLAGHQSGIKYMVAALGTSLTDRQVGLLKKLTRNIVLALDPDAAGEAATLKGLDVARQTFGGKASPVPTGKGIVVESTLDADIRIVSLPPGMDPDDLILKDPQEWQRRLEAAKPVVDYYFDVLLADLDLASAKGKSAAVQRLGPVIREISDLMQRWTYIQQLAQRLGVNEQVVATAIGQPVKRQNDKRQRIPQKEIFEETGKRKRQSSIEDYCVWLLVRNPELARQPSRIPVEEVDSPEGREILRSLYQRVATGDRLNPDTFRDSCDEVLGRYLDNLNTQFRNLPELPTEELEREAVKSFENFKRWNKRKHVPQLCELFQDAKAAGDKDTDTALRAKVESLLVELEPLERGSARPTGG